MWNVSYTHTPFASPVSERELTSAIMCVRERGGERGREREGERGRERERERERGRERERKRARVFLGLQSSTNTFI